MRDASRSDPIGLKRFPGRSFPLRFVRESRFLSQHLSARTRISIDRGRRLLAYFLSPWNVSRGAAVSVKSSERNEFYGETRRNERNCARIAPRFTLLPFSFPRSFLSTPAGGGKALEKRRSALFNRIDEQSIETMDRSAKTRSRNGPSCDRKRTYDFNIEKLRRDCKERTTYLYLFLRKKSQ